VRGYNFLFWAYNVVWIGIVAYLAYLFVQLRKVGDRLDRLERRIDRENPEGGQGPEAA
jgi:CcmD family protein